MLKIFSGVDFGCCANPMVVTVVAVSYRACRRSTPNMTAKPMVPTISTTRRPTSASHTRRHGFRSLTPRSYPIGSAAVHRHDGAPGDDVAGTVDDIDLVVVAPTG